MFLLSYEFSVFPPLVQLHADQNEVTQLVGQQDHQRPVGQVDQEELGVPGLVESDLQNHVDQDKEEHEDSEKKAIERGCVRIREYKFRISFLKAH